MPPREHGGNCDIKNLSRGSKVYFPVYVKGAGLSMGDLHFSQGDGEITFCGAIEMAGWIHLRVELIKGGMAKYGMKNPIFKPSPIEPHYDDYLIFEGISRRRERQAALPGRARRLPAGLPERDRVPEEVRLHRRAGVRHPRHARRSRAASAASSTSPTPAPRCGCRPSIFEFDINPGSDGPKKFLDGSADVPLAPDL